MKSETMNIPLRSRDITADQLQLVLAKHQLWLDTEGEYGDRADLSQTNLTGVTLGKANLHRVDFTGANLANADLSHARLHHANFEGANLSEVKLIGAELHHVNFSRAKLVGADLSGANFIFSDIFQSNFAGAIFSDDTVIETADTWREYLDSVVPALLTAGGKTVEQIVKAGAWDPSSWPPGPTWVHTPVGVAFGVPDHDELPKLLWPRVVQFDWYFVNDLIPKPRI